VAVVEFSQGRGHFRCGVLCRLLRGGGDQAGELVAIESARCFVKVDVDNAPDTVTQTRTRLSGEDAETAPMLSMA
jgi:hypothetical protein